MELKIESVQKDESQVRMKDCHVGSESTIQDIKCTRKVNPINELGNKILKSSSLKNCNFYESPLQRLCNFVDANSQLNEANSQEVQKFLFTKGEVQNVVSKEEMYGVIIELVDSLRSSVVQRQEQNFDTASMNNLGVEKQDSSILTYEDLISAFHTDILSRKNVSQIKAADKNNVLKGVTVKSMIQNLEKWIGEAQSVGLEWVPINNNAIGFRVDSIQAWLVALILVHEAQCNVKLQDKVDFKFGIDALTIPNKQGIMCEVMLELLCNPSPLSCVSVAKWKGEDQCWDEIFSELAETKDSKNLLCQLVAICEDGLDVGDRHLNVTFIECHHMAFYYSKACNGITKTLEQQFCPWCTIPHQDRCIVTMNHIVSSTDTIAFLCSTYHMRPQLLMELNPSLEDLLPKDKIHEFFPQLKTIIVFRHWPINRHNIYKLISGTILNTTYCTRHALIRTILRMVKTLGMQAQQYDQINEETEPRFMLLWQAMTHPPLLIECEITTPDHANAKEIKYDEFDEEVANHILENHEKLLEVMEKIPTPTIFMYTKLMWTTYRRFNRLQQMNNFHSSVSNHESLAVVAKEFLYYATKALGDGVTPYIHIQGAHAGQFQTMLPYPMGRLKNAAMQRKHKALKNTPFPFCTIDGKKDIYNKQDNFGLNIEMAAQYVRFKMEAMPVLQDLKKQVESWIPWLARSYLYCHFENIGCVPISIDKAEELADMFPNTTANQVFCLFNNWSKKYNERQSKTKDSNSSKDTCITRNNNIDNDVHEDDVKMKIQTNSYACIQPQNKMNSYLNQYNLVMANNKTPNSIHVLHMEEGLPLNKHQVSYNLKMKQASVQCSNTYNDIHGQFKNQNGKKVTNNKDRCINWIDTKELQGALINNVPLDVIEEGNFNDKDHKSLEQASLLTNTKPILCEQDEEQTTNKQELEQMNVGNIYETPEKLDIKCSGVGEKILLNNDILNKIDKNNNEEAKTNHVLELQNITMQISENPTLQEKNKHLNVINNKQVLDRKNTLPLINDEKLLELLTLDVIVNNNTIKTSLCSIVEHDKDKFTNSSIVGQDIEIEHEHLELSNILENLHSSNTMPILKSQDEIDLKHENETQHMDMLKEKSQNDFTPKCDEILKKELHTQKFNVQNEKLTFEDYQFESHVFESNLKVLQFFSQNHQSNNKITSKICNPFKPSRKNSNNELDKLLKTNFQTENNGFGEQIHTKLLDVEPCTSKQNVQQSCENTQEILTLSSKNETFSNTELSSKTVIEFSLENQDKCKKSTMENLSDLHLPLPFPYMKDTISLEDLFVLPQEESKKYISSQNDCFECHLPLNEKKELKEDVLCASKTIDEIIEECNNTIFDEYESSHSQSYSITPEDGGILRNKRHKVDDVLQNMKSSKLKSFETSLDSLSKKSRSYRKLYMKKLYNDYNPKKSYTQPTTSYSNSAKNDLKTLPTKVDTLYPCYPYRRSKPEWNKSKVETFYPCNPYPQHGEESNNKKKCNKPKEIDFKNSNHFIEHKFSRQHVDQSPYKLKKNFEVSSPKCTTSSTTNHVPNYNESSLRPVAPKPHHFSKKNQFIKDDKEFFQTQKSQFEHNELDDCKTENFIPFIFDDARFLVPSHHQNIHIFNDSCHEQEKFASKIKEAVIITPETCMDFEACLQCEQAPEPMVMAKELFNSVLVPTISTNSENLKYRAIKNHSDQFHKASKICPILEESLIEVTSDNMFFPTPSNEEMQTNQSVRNENVTKTINRLEKECIHVNEEKEVKKRIGTPCCCDPACGHSTSCYQYVPKYEPPEVTKINNKKILHNSRAGMNYEEQCYQQLMTLQRARLGVSNFKGECERTNKLQKAQMSSSSQPQSCRNIDKGDANVESNLSMKTRSSYREKYCVYDRIGRYSRNNGSRPIFKYHSHNI